MKVQKNMPELVSQAVQLVSLYQHLWGLYVMEFAKEKSLNHEQSLLQGSNIWLLQNMDQMRQLCVDREIILFDCREAVRRVQTSIPIIFTGNLQS